MTRGAKLNASLSFRPTTSVDATSEALETSCASSDGTMWRFVSTPALTTTLGVFPHSSAYTGVAPTSTAPATYAKKPDGEAFARPEHPDAHISGATIRARPAYRRSAERCSAPCGGRGQRRNKRT